MVCIGAGCLIVYHPEIENKYKIINIYFKDNYWFCFKNKFVKIYSINWLAWISTGKFWKISVLLENEQENHTNW